MNCGRAWFLCVYALLNLWIVSCASSIFFLIGNLHVPLFMNSGRFSIVGAHDFFVIGNLHVPRFMNSGRSWIVGAHDFFVCALSWICCCACVCAREHMRECVHANVCTCMRSMHTGWQRCIRCLRLQVSFCKRTISYRTLLQKMTCRTRDSMRLRHPVSVHTPPTRADTDVHVHAQVGMHIHTCTIHTDRHRHRHTHIHIHDTQTHLQTYAHA